MKRGMLTTGTLLAAGALGLWLAGDARTAKAASGDTVTWEAEEAGKVEAPFAKKSGKRSDKSPKPKKNSGGGWVEIANKANGTKKEGEGSQLPGVAQYKVNVPAAGNYTLWARVLWPDGCGNSFWVLREGRPKQVLGEDGTYDSWHWVAARQKVALTKGVNVIELRNREDGVLCDQLHLTTTSRVPTGEVRPTPGALVK